MSKTQGEKEQQINLVAFKGQKQNDDLRAENTREAAVLQYVGNKLDLVGSN